MNPIIFSIVGFSLACAIMIRFRLKWMKDIPNLSSKKMQEAIASRITLDMVYLTLFAWPIFRLPMNIDIITFKSIIMIFMLAITVVFFSVFFFLRWKFGTEKSLD